MCIQGPQLPNPTLGAGLSLEPPGLPPFTGDLGLCCKTVSYSTPPLTPPLPLHVLSSPVVVAAISTAMTAVQAYLDALPPKCPLE